MNKGRRMPRRERLLRAWIPVLYWRLKWQQREPLETLGKVGSDLILSRLSQKSVLELLFPSVPVEHDESMALSHDLLLYGNAYVRDGKHVPTADVLVVMGRTMKPDPAHVIVEERTTPVFERLLTKENMKDLIALGAKDVMSRLEEREFHDEEE